MRIAQSSRPIRTSQQRAQPNPTPPHSVMRLRTRQPGDGTQSTAQPEGACSALPSTPETLLVIVLPAHVATALGSRARVSATQAGSSMRSDRRVGGGWGLCSVARARASGSHSDVQPGREVAGICAVEKARLWGVQRPRCEPRCTTLATPAYLPALSPRADSMWPAGEGSGRQSSPPRRAARAAGAERGGPPDETRWCPRIGRTDSPLVRSPTSRRTRRRRTAPWPSPPGSA